MEALNLNTEELTKFANEAASQFLAGALDFAGAFVGAIVILILGFAIAGWAGRATRRLLDRSARVDSTLKPFLTSIVRYIIIVVTLVTVLGVFGVPMASLIAVLGAAGLAIGLALQGTLSNVAAGVMLLTLRPFRIDDFVKLAGEMGTVTQIGLFTTELVTLDNLFISLPNSSVWGSTIVNYTRMPTRRVDLTVSIDYSDDIDRAMRVIREAFEADSRVLSDPEPQIAVKALGNSSVDLFARGFTATPDWWPATCDLLKDIKERFDRAGITIPYPQTTLHLRASELPKS
ncbi:MAG: mechanosensitive ion channel family protein [Alphaproteobacteria bacterium]